MHSTIIIKVAIHIPVCNDLYAILIFIIGIESIFHTTQTIQKFHGSHLVYFNQLSIMYHFFLDIHVNCSFKNFLDYSCIMFFQQDGIGINEPTHFLVDNNTLYSVSPRCRSRIMLFHHSDVPFLY